MLELFVILVFIALGAVERTITGRLHAEERRHLLALLTAAQVSPAAAAAAAKPLAPRPPAEPRPIQAM